MRSPRRSTAVESGSRRLRPFSPSSSSSSSSLAERSIGCSCARQQDSKSLWALRRRRRPRGLPSLEPPQLSELVLGFPGPDRASLFRLVRDPICDIETVQDVALVDYFDRLIEEALAAWIALARARIRDYAKSRDESVALYASWTLSRRCESLGVTRLAQYVGVPRSWPGFEDPPPPAAAVAMREIVIAAPVALRRSCPVRGCRRTIKYARLDFRRHSLFWFHHMATFASPLDLAFMVESKCLSCRVANSSHETSAHVITQQFSDIGLPLFLRAYSVDLRGLRRFLFALSIASLRDSNSSNAFQTGITLAVSPRSRAETRYLEISAHAHVWQARAVLFAWMTCELPLTSACRSATFGWRHITASAARAPIPQGSNARLSLSGVLVCLLFYFSGTRAIC